MWAALRQRKEEELSEKERGNSDGREEVKQTRDGEKPACSAFKKEST